MQRNAVALTKNSHAFLLFNYTVRHVNLRWIFVHYFIFKQHIDQTLQAMSMNTLDPRLYHYEYRRPRLSNPTYNSNNLFDSLNMFAKIDMPSGLARSYARYSLPKSQKPLENYSQTIDNRSNRVTSNFSTILPPLQSQRQRVMLPDKEQKYLQSLEEKGDRTRRSSQYEQMRGASQAKMQRIVLICAIDWEILQLKGQRISSHQKDDFYWQKQKQRLISTEIFLIHESSFPVSAKR